MRSVFGLNFENRSITDCGGHGKDWDTKTITEKATSWKIGDSTIPTDMALETNLREDFSSSLRQR